jgi:hypothetical protein
MGLSPRASNLLLRARPEFRNVLVGCRPLGSPEIWIAFFVFYASSAFVSNGRAKATCGNGTYELWFDPLSKIFFF